MDIASMILAILLTVATAVVVPVEAISNGDTTLLKQRLKLINKPAIKSFQTDYGDIIDCVDIHKQLAFDHPLLRKHKIQMKPSANMSKFRRSTENYSSAMKASPIHPLKVRCPHRTVPIRRTKAEDLATSRAAPPSMPFLASNSSKFSYPLEDQIPQQNHVASLVVNTKNWGVLGQLNVWSPEVNDPRQFSSASIYVTSDDGPVSNAIVAGWSVDPYLYENFTRLNTYWTNDSGRSTGCFNVVCPGFVQTSQEIPLGVIVQPVSTYGGTQYFIEINIQKDAVLGNWWLYYQGVSVGYWPDELFSTLKDGATSLGWGGEVGSPVPEPTPAMGSGHLPNEGLAKASFFKNLQYLDSAYSVILPNKDDLSKQITNPACYDLIYGGDAGGDWREYFFYGGPPSCPLRELPQW